MFDLIQISQSRSSLFDRTKESIILIFLKDRSDDQKESTVDFKYSRSSNPITLTTTNFSVKRLFFGFWLFCCYLLQESSQKRVCVINSGACW